MAEDEDKLRKLHEIKEFWDTTGDRNELNMCLEEFSLKSLDDLYKQITLLTARIDRTKQKIMSANNGEETPVEEPPAKQSKITKIVFESEKEMHAYVQNAKKMVRFKFSYGLKYLVLFFIFFCFKVI